MAAPITHIVLFEKIYNSQFSDKDRLHFIVGTSFPDIRYLGKIDRSKTHFPDVSMQDIMGSDPFKAGLKFHSFVDRVRENFLLSRNIYEFCPKSKYITQSVKFLEDIVLYSKVNDWDSYKSMLDNVLEEELSFGLSEEHISHWHKILQTYFAVQPDLTTVDKFVSGIGFGKEVAEEIKEVTESLKGIKEVTDYIDALYQNFGTDKLI
ncbi:hypothetical protein C4561_04950 [candidate division WWE3 bacterium]|jgi:hypothetical protein|uniref:Uncharacterized protein n=1 Tax=candidate division WWE3 bacterium TaxID=2053526 RepID=A0A3A4ZB72_UNCKA|nr:MAG: hypothetical protein C4561_04950 [candidate division WWE3 bacterium]